MSAQATTGRASGPTRNSLIAALHVLKKERGWSDDEYRDVLGARTGKRSAGDLSFGELAQLVADLRAKPVRLPSGGAYQPRSEAQKAADQRQASWGFIDEQPDNKRPLLRKIYAICRSLGVGRRYAEGISKRQFGNVTRRLEWMTPDDLYRVVQALATTQRAAQQRADRESSGKPTEETRS